MLAYKSKTSEFYIQFKKEIRGNLMNLPVEAMFHVV